MKVQSATRDPGGKLRLGIFGRGRLAQAVIAQADRDGGFELAWSLGRGEQPEAPVDVALDASAADALGSRIDWALEHGVDLVIGTTGWTLPGLDERLGGRIGVLVAPNFSLGVALQRRLALVLGRYAALDPASGLGIVERHHAAKSDAPSGTALSLVAALSEGCPRYTGWCQGRPEAGKISVASLRAGFELGTHEAVLDTRAETLSITHAARSREVFAAGALAALRWIRGRKGLFTFDELAASLLDPLFAPPKRGKDQP